MENIKLASLLELLSKFEIEEYQDKDVRIKFASKSLSVPLWDEDKFKDEMKKIDEEFRDDEPVVPPNYSFDEYKL